MVEPTGRRAEAESGTQRLEAETRDPPAMMPMETGRPVANPAHRCWAEELALEGTDEALALEGTDEALALEGALVKHALEDREPLLGWTGPAETKEGWTGPAETKEGWTGLAETKEGWTGPTETKEGWTGPAETKEGWTGPAETKEGWTGPAETKEGWTGPAEMKEGWTGPAETKEGIKGQDTTPLPLLVLREILLEVVLQDGDVAVGSLALTCRCFNSIVSMESFRRDAHFQWLDSVVNWTAFSKDFRNLYRVPYSLSTCLHCETTYKDCGEGYRGRGQRGVLQGFFGSDDFQGYCGSDCFYEPGGSI
ncbi:hypothetical protein QQF64_036105 [Cirrhinus molitorella]|uniref:CxC7-like cysteine cluster associated with KDZ transposases domain-containing protein n=1 Tax=Cirrhinus molitorella TaxID=172907 RepID=A0ABR3NHL3_9TELE